ncbi:MAG TPA: hypothetical protein PLO51_02750 [Candidatus Micrarchaeota archaeon]|nr:hypothetical protein [Candidatus Micrarchaeota archaeon]
MATKQIAETKGTDGKQAGTGGNQAGAGNKTGNATNKTFEKIREKSNAVAGPDEAGDFARKGIMSSYNCRSGNGTAGKESKDGGQANAFMGMNPFAAGNATFNRNEVRVMF